MRKQDEGRLLTREELEEDGKADVLREGENVIAFGEYMRRTEGRAVTRKLEKEGA
ncbi:MAG: hypothetical protein ACE5I2_07445 [Anaerolineae bacterium]